MIWSYFFYHNWSAKSKFLSQNYERYVHFKGSHVLLNRLFQLHHVVALSKTYLFLHFVSFIHVWVIIQHVFFSISQNSLPPDDVMKFRVSVFLKSRPDPFSTQTASTTKHVLLLGSSRHVFSFIQTASLHFCAIRGGHVVYLEIGSLSCFP